MNGARFLRMDNFTLYIVAIVAILIAAILIKRFVSCLFRSIVTIILIIILAYLYFTYLQ